MKFLYTASGYHVIFRYNIMMSALYVYLSLSSGVKRHSYLQTVFIDTAVLSKGEMKMRVVGETKECYF